MINSTQKELWGKVAGMEMAAAPHSLELEQARRIARILASNGSEISIEDVRESLPHLDYGAWTGSLFKDKEWEPCGFVQARHKNSHCRIVRLWKLRD